MKKKLILSFLSIGFLLASCQDNVSSSNVENSTSSNSTTSESVSESSSSFSTSIDENVSNVKFIVKTINVDLNGTNKLQWKIYPNTAKNKNVSFEVEDKTIASVDNEGTIKGLKVGSTIVTITTEEGNFKDIATINVIAQQAESIKLKVPEGTLVDNGIYLLKVGQRLQLSYEMNPTNSVNTVTFSSKDSSSGDASNYLSVSKTGLLKALKLKAKITISVTTDNLFTDSITFSVVKDSIYSQVFLNQQLDKSTAIEQEKVVSGTKKIIHKKPKTSIDDETNETFNIYNNGVSRTYEVKDRYLNSTKNYEGFYGIYNNKFYQLNRYNNTYSSSSVTSIGEEDNQISLLEAEKQSSLAFYRSSYGFANIIKNEYVSSTSYLAYTGDWQTYTFTEKNNTYTIEASYENKSTYFGTTSYYRTFSLMISLNEEGMITSYNFTCNDYDSQNYDFTNHKLKDNPTSLEKVEHTFTQEIGTRTNNDSFTLFPSQCYFTSYTMKTYSLDEGSYNSFEVGDYINFKVDTFAPITATSSIDKIKFVSSSNENVASFSTAGGLKAVGEGKATLKFVSSNGVESSIEITVKYKTLESITINASDGVQVGNILTDIEASVNSGANPNYELSIMEGEEFATLTYNETTKKYSLLGVKEGKVVLCAKSLFDENIKTTKTIYVYNPVSEDDVLSTLLKTKYQTVAYNNKTYILVFLENGKGKVVDGFEDYSTTYGTFEYSVEGFTIKISNVKTLNNTIFYALEDLTMDTSGLYLKGKLATNKNSYNKKEYTFTKCE